MHFPDPLSHVHYVLNAVSVRLNKVAVLILFVLMICAQSGSCRCGNRCTCMTHVFAVSRRLLLLPISPVAHQKQQLKKLGSNLYGTNYWYSLLVFTVLATKRVDLYSFNNQISADLLFTFTVVIDFL